MNETERLQYEKLQRSLNPKTKIRRVSKIEEDGTKTTARVIDFGNRAVFHSEDGPALINKEQRRKEYYLNGIEYTFDDWNEIIKGKEGLPWYKKPAPKGHTYRN
jgi:hypothetical protein|tara:strand:+ start:70 stop:381 length:312 start_codon:yes stop_codon:yes gene_type:complete